MYITRATQSAAASSFKRSNFFYLIYFPLASLDRFSSEIADMPALNTWVGLLEREALPPPNITDLRSGEIAAIVLGAVTSVAGILALFKGWKFWKQKKRGATERVSGHDLGHEFVRIDGGTAGSQEIQQPCRIICPNFTSLALSAGLQSTLLNRLSWRASRWCRHWAPHARMGNSASVSRKVTHSYHSPDIFRFFLLFSFSILFPLLSFLLFPCVLGAIKRRPHLVISS
ncbi:hypothetical protein HOY82DRAFT_392300 [Tuber indicum]|nr:hypothetical protein HOY82DRAFT_392300 [Tuber indicum]